MNFISLFAGIGGFDLGLERAGMNCVAQVEIDDFAQSILNKHWPSVPKFKDVRDVGKENLQPANLICGGFPCQDVSLQGERKGLGGKRSTLWSEFHRIICEIRPGWVVIENVLGLLSSDNGGFFRKILWELSKIGYDAQWDVIPTGYTFGLPHQRERVFIVAYPKRERLDEIQVFDRSAFEVSSIPGEYSDPGNKKIWEIPETDFCRTPNGFSGGVDRFKGTGNAVVPQVAEWIGRRIMEADSRL